MSDTGQDVRDSLQEAIERDPADLDARWALLHIHLDAGERDEASALARGGVEVDYEEPDEYYELGELLEELAQPEGAAVAYARAYGLTGDRDTAYNLGILLHESERSREAIDWFRKALEGDEEKPAVHNWLGIVHVHVDDLEAAERYYRRALELDPSHPLAWFNLGRLLLMQDRTSEALEPFRKAAELLPDDPDAWWHLASTYGDLEQHETAIAAWERAFALGAPEDLRNQLGIDLAVLGRYEEALEQYEAALRTADDDAAVWNNYGISLTAVGRTDDALKAYQRALSLSPQRGKHLENMGRLLVDLDQPRRAARVLRRALRDEPESADIQYELGRALEAAGDVDGAVAPVARGD